MAVIRQKKLSKMRLISVTYKTKTRLADETKKKVGKKIGKRTAVSYSHISNFFASISLV